MPRLRRALACALLAGVLAGCAPAAGSRFSTTGPDAEAYGASQGYRFLAIYRQPFLVGSFSHGDLLFEARTIPRAAAPSSLRRAPVEPVVRYEHDGQTRTLEATYCCLNGVLRDYARLGLLLARDGRQGARQLIPRDWILTATTVRADDWHLKPYAATSYYGYGYQTWILPGPRRLFALLGVHGQAIFVDPASQLVMVHTAVMLDAADRLVEARALWRGVVATLGAGS